MKTQQLGVPDENFLAVQVLQPPAPSSEEGLASYSSSTAGSCQACHEQLNNDDFVIYYENQQRNSAQVPKKMPQIGCSNDMDVLPLNLMVCSVSRNLRSPCHMS